MVPPFIGTMNIWVSISLSTMLANRNVTHRGGTCHIEFAERGFNLLLLLTIDINN